MHQCVYTCGVDLTLFPFVALAATTLEDERVGRLIRWVV